MFLLHVIRDIEGDASNPHSRLTYGQLSNCCELLQLFRKIYNIIIIVFVRKKEDFGAFLLNYSLN